MTGDPRYSQARQLHQSQFSEQGRHGQGCPSDRDGPGPYPGGPVGPTGGGPSYPGGETPPSSFQNTQLLQLRAQILAYRMLAKYQPLHPQIAQDVTGKKADPESAT